MHGILIGNEVITISVALDDPQLAQQIKRLREQTRAAHTLIYQVLGATFGPITTSCSRRGCAKI